MSEKLRPVAERLLKMYNLLHPYSPYANEDTKKLAYKLGFRKGSIDIKHLRGVYDNPEIRIADIQELAAPNALASIGGVFLKSLDSETARDYFERYYELVFDDDRDIMTCELNDDDDMNWLLSSLDSIRMDEGWLLDNTGGVSMDLYVRPVGTKRPPVGPCDISSHLNEHYRPYVIPEEDIISPFEHIRLPFTRKALWQIYLLYSSTDILGKFGHGGYNLKKFVFEDSDLASKNDADDSFNLKEKKPLIRYLLGKNLYPTIITDTTYAMITHYWINDWKGLYQTHMIVKYDQRSYTIKDWYRVDEEPLIRYNCGIWY